MNLIFFFFTKSRTSERKLTEIFGLTNHFFFVPQFLYTVETKLFISEYQIDQTEIKYITFFYVRHFTYTKITMSLNNLGYLSKLSHGLAVMLTYFDVLYNGGKKGEDSKLAKHTQL